MHIKHVLYSLFSNENSHWCYSHSSESYETHSVLNWQYKAWVLSVFGRWAFHSPVWKKWCHALKLIWEFQPTSLCFWAVDVALATAITSSSDLCLQVEDPFATGKFLFVWLWSIFLVQSTTLMIKQEHEGLNHPIHHKGYELISGMGFSSQSINHTLHFQLQTGINYTTFKMANQSKGCVVQP